MEPRFSYLNAFRDFRISPDQTFVINLFAANYEIQFPPHIARQFSFVTTTDLYFVDRQDNCLHINPKREGDNYWIKATDIGRIRSLYPPSRLLILELSYVGWGIFYMLAWDHTFNEEKPRAVNQIYASRVLPARIIEMLANRFGIQFNKEAQLSAFEAERALWLQRQIQQRPAPASEQSRINLRQQGGGAVAGPSRRNRIPDSSDSSESSINQRTPSP